jgi:hypothetical protein
MRLSRAHATASRAWTRTLTDGLSQVREPPAIRTVSSRQRATVCCGDDITGIDKRNLAILIKAVLHASSHRQFR